jgi:hypothetical protein
MGFILPHHLELLVDRIFAACSSGTLYLVIKVFSSSLNTFFSMVLMFYWRLSSFDMGMTVMFIMIVFLCFGAKPLKLNKQHQNGQ